MERLVELLRGQITVPPSRLAQLKTAFRFHKQLPVSHFEFNLELQNILKRLEFSSLNSQARQLKQLIDLLLDACWERDQEISMGIFVFLAQFKRKIDHFAFKVQEFQKTVNAEHVTFAMQRTVFYSSDSEDEKAEGEKEENENERVPSCKSVAFPHLRMVSKSKTRIGQLVDLVFDAILHLTPMEKSGANSLLKKNSNKVLERNQLFSKDICPDPIANATNKIIVQLNGDQERKALVLNLLLQRKSFTVLELLQLLEDRILPDLATDDWREVEVLTAIRCSLLFEEEKKKALKQLEPFIELASKYSIDNVFDIGQCNSITDLQEFTRDAIQSINAQIEPFIRKEQEELSQSIEFYFLKQPQLRSIFIHSCTIQPRETWQFLNYFHLSLTGSSHSRMRIYRCETLSAKESELIQTFWFWSFDFVHPTAVLPNLPLFQRALKVLATLACLEERFHQQRNELKLCNRMAAKYVLVEWIWILRHVWDWEAVLRCLDVHYELVCSLLLLLKKVVCEDVECFEELIRQWSFAVELFRMI